MGNIPWNDVAVLLHLTSDPSLQGEYTIEDEGCLRDIVRRLDDRRPSLITRKISLPDRRQSPYGYDAAGIAQLIAAYRKLMKPVPPPKPTIEI